MTEVTTGKRKAVWQGCGSGAPAPAGQRATATTQAWHDRTHTLCSRAKELWRRATCSSNLVGGQAGDKPSRELQRSAIHRDSIIESHSELTAPRAAWRVDFSVTCLVEAAAGSSWGGQRATPVSCSRVKSSPRYIAHHIDWCAGCQVGVPGRR